jgi:hypothetical protein
MNTSKKAFVDLAQVQLRQDQRLRAQYALHKAEAFVNGVLALAGGFHTSPRGQLLRPSFKN